MNSGGSTASETDALRVRLRQCADAFADGRGVGDWDRIRELDSQLQPLLRELRRRPALTVALARELAALQRQHALALAACRQQLAELEQKMQTFQREREGLRAYGEISGVEDAR